MKLKINQRNNNKNKKIQSSNNKKTNSTNTMTFSISSPKKDIPKIRIKSSLIKGNSKDKNLNNKNIQKEDKSYNKIKLDKNTNLRSTSAKPIQMQAKKNNFNQKIYDKILAFKKNEKNKQKNAMSKNKVNNTDNINSKVINKSLYLNEKDILDLEKNIKNSLNIFLNVMHIHGKIEYELINIIENSDNDKDKKDIYKNLFQLLNNFFEQFNSNNKLNFNFFIQNELNKMIQRTLELLLSYQSILFINIILLSVNDSISILNVQYDTQFKKISKIIYNIFYKLIYVDLKNRNLFQKNFSLLKEFIENQINKLMIRNYQFNLNKKSTEQIISFFNKLIDTSFSELKELTETMRFSSLSPAANSIKLLINSINKKNFPAFVDVINNVILYSLLNQNIEIAYKNMVKDKNSDEEIIYSRNSVPYLPKISKEKNYTLILDMDETLIHYFYSKVETGGEPKYGYFSSDEEYGLFNNYLLNNNENQNGNINNLNNQYLKIGMFLLRPYAKQFLHELNKYYEIAIFTTGTKEYCDRILQLLDLDNNLVKYRLYKHHIALNYGNVNVKDLSLLGRDLSKTIIVDNLEENFRLQPDNGLPIITWKGDINDFSLKYLTTILKNIVINKVQDVRKIVKKIKLQIKSEKNPCYSKVNVQSLF